VSPPASIADPRAAALDGGEGDAALVAGLRRGEGQALDRAFSRYKNRLYAFLFRLGGRRDLADDLLQETFLQLARHALRLRPDTDLSAWLFTVARNAWRASLRHQLAGDRALEALPEPRAGAPDPERAAETSAAIAGLRAALAALSESEREVLLLGAEGELSSEQAAAVLAIRPDAFRKRLERARAALATRIAEAEETAPLSPPSRRGVAP